MPARSSNTQQDVLEQLFVDAALKADSTADIALAVERVAGRRAIPPERFVGWRKAAGRAAMRASWARWSRGPTTRPDRPVPPPNDHRPARWSFIFIIATVAAMPPSVLIKPLCCA